MADRKKGLLTTVSGRANVKTRVHFRYPYSDTTSSITDWAPNLKQTASSAAYPATDLTCVQPQPQCFVHGRTCAFMDIPGMSDHGEASTCFKRLKDIMRKTNFSSTVFGKVG